MTILELKQAVEQHFGDYGPEVMASKGKKLDEVPHQLTLKFDEKFSLQIQRLISDEKLSDNQDFETLIEILRKTWDIKSKFNKYSIIINKVKAKVRAQAGQLVSEDRLQEEMDSIFNANTVPSDFFTESEHAEKIFQNLIQTVCTNLAISCGLFTGNAQINVEELENLDSRLAHHAKKTAFDQICQLVFGHHPGDYDIMRKKEEMDSNHLINNFMEFKIKKNQVLFGYVDLNPLTVPKFPRFASLISSHHGVGCVVDEILHQHKVLDIQVTIAGETVTVKVPVWFGLIVTKIDSSATKSLDLETVLEDASKLVKRNKNLAGVTTPMSSENNVGNNYFKVFESLATSTNENYSQIKSQLRQQGNINASH